MATWIWLWRRTMLGKGLWIEPTVFRPIGKPGITCRRCRTPITGRARDVLTMLMFARTRFTATWTPTGASYSRTSERSLGYLCGEFGARMSSAQKNFHKVFAGASLGFALLGLLSIPCLATTRAASSSSVKREAASSQFSRAEELRATINSKPPEKRTLAEYKQVVSSYRRVYLITPHAIEVPDALFAVGELNTEMGDRFGRSYYQTAVDSYMFLIREYPTSKHLQEAMLNVANLQKDQLGDPIAATKS